MTSFVVMQWNILARGLCSDDSFPAVSPACLNWEKRAVLFTEILSRCSSIADIICCEEVDQPLFLAECLPEYEYVWFAKGDSPCLFATPNWGPDGTAIFVKRSVWDIVKSEKLILTTSLYKNNQIAVLARLRHKESNKEINIAAVHLKAKGGFEEVRAAQCATFIEGLKAFGGGPWCVCGDFNAQKTEPAFTLMEEADYVNSDVAAARPHSFTTAKLRLNKSGEFTPLQYTIDYIFTKDVPLMSDSEVLYTDPMAEKLLPSLAMPSDHLPVKVKLCI